MRNENNYRASLLLRCDCNSLAHLAQFIWFADDEPEMRDLILEVILPRETFWQRLVSAWRLLTNRLSPYGDLAEVTLRPEDAREMIDFMREYLKSFERDN